MKKHSFGARIRYRFDNFMARGTVSLVLALLAFTLLMILAAALIIRLAHLSVGGSADLSFGEALWQAMVRTIDTGTVAGDTGWSFRILAFLVTMGGIFIVSALISILANGLDERLNDLRRGRSQVVENDHMVILGWSPQVFTILSELAIVNHKLSRWRRAIEQTGRRAACAVVLADKDKVEMEEEIRVKVPDLLGLRIVCRSGDPLDPDDLKIVSPETARSVIIVSPGGQYPDMPTIKTLMALTRDRAAREKPYHIVTTIRRPVNIDLARLVGGDETQVFMVDRLIAYLIAQTCRQPGLSVVYSELFSFDGSAMYFFAEPGLLGLTYGEASVRCEQAVPIGLRFQNGETRLNPPMDTVIQDGDQIIAIAASGGSLSLLEQAQVSIDAAAIRERPSQPGARPPEHLLILGWNRRGAMILAQLDQYVPAGSQARVVAMLDPQQMQTDCASLDFKQLDVTFEAGSITDRQALEKLQVDSFQYIIVLNPMEAIDAQLADAMTVVTLLYLRDIARQAGRSYSIVSEILDERNRDLVEITSAEDMIISERLIALALSQLAVNKEIMPVFIDLLSSGGAEIYLKPAGDYVHLGQPVNFYTLLAAARRRGETAIGYRLLAEASDDENSFGVHLNPPKGEPVVLGEMDRLIVLADMGE